MTPDAAASPRAMTMAEDGPSGPTSLAAALAEIAQLGEERGRLELELSETNRGVVALYAELEDQAERLRQADATKSRFLSRVSHELRTPINSVVALSRLLEERVDGELTDGQATQVGYIRQAAQDLSVLVDDLLDLARIEAGRDEVRSVEFRLDDLFSGLRGTLKPLAARPDVVLDLRSAGDVPPLLTDEGKLAQILRNFISNALKFTHAGSVTVTPRFVPDRATIRIEVADTGVGIAATSLEGIWQEFSQVPGDHQIGVRGTGLGLAVSRGLAELLGGEVGVTSAPGQGSTFWVEVPAIHQPPTPAVRDDEPSTTGTTVLLIDDDPAARYLIRHALTSRGHRVLEATSGRQGIERVIADAPSAIVLDLSLPDLDGSDVLAELRADPRTAAIPVIVRSGRDLAPAEQRALRAASDVLLRKSGPPGAVASAIADLVRGAESVAAGQSVR